MTPARRTAIRLFVTCWLVYTVHWSPFLVREHFPAMALAERGTMNAEEYLDVTQDIFQTSRGAFINNNPGASMAGALPIFVARPLLRAIERWNKERTPPRVGPTLEAPLFRKAVEQHREWYFLAIGFITVAGLMAPVTALCVSLLYAWLVGARGVPHRAALTFSALLAFATPFFLRTGYLNHNLMVAVTGVLGFMAIAGSRGSGPTGARAALAGLASGLAVLLDYSGVMVAGMLWLYLVFWPWPSDRSASRLSRTAAFAAGVAPGLAGLLAYQWMAFGAPLPAQHFMPAIEPTRHGYRGIDWPSWELLWMNLFDLRFGLFVYCPILLVAGAAPLVRRVPVRLPAPEQWFLVAFSIVFLMFCAANRYSSLQWTTGIRYLVPVLPAMLALSLQVLQAVPRPIGWALAAMSLGMNWVVAIGRDRFGGLWSGDLQLSWVRRMVELDIVANGQWVTAWTLLATVVIVCLIWRKELTCVS